MVFLAVGLGFTVYLSRQRRLKKWLRQKGTLVNAPVHGVIPLGGVGTGRSGTYYVVQAVWKDPTSGKDYLIRSAPLSWDP